MNDYLTRPVVTGLAVLSAGLSVWTATQINLGASSAFRHIVTALVLTAVAVALWALRPDGEAHAPRPTYQRGPSLRERVSALTQPAPLPHRPHSRYPGQGAPTSYPEPTPYPEPPTPEPLPPAPPAPTFRADGEFSHLDSVFGHDDDGGR